MKISNTQSMYAMSKYFLSKTYWDTWFQKSKHKRFVIFLKAQKNVDTSLGNSANLQCPAHFDKWTKKCGKFKFLKISYIFCALAGYGATEMKIMNLSKKMQPQLLVFQIAINCQSRPDQPQLLRLPKLPPPH